MQCVHSIGKRIIPIVKYIRVVRQSDKKKNNIIDIDSLRFVGFFGFYNNNCMCIFLVHMHETQKQNKHIISLGHSLGHRLTKSICWIVHTIWNATCWSPKVPKQDQSQFNLHMTIIGFNPILQTWHNLTKWHFHFILYFINFECKILCVGESMYECNTKGRTHGICRVMACISFVCKWCMILFQWGGWCECIEWFRVFGLICDVAILLG